MYSTSSSIYNLFPKLRNSMKQIVYNYALRERYWQLSKIFHFYKTIAIIVFRFRYIFRRILNTNRLNSKLIILKCQEVTEKFVPATGANIHTSRGFGGYRLGSCPCPSLRFLGSSPGVAVPLTALWLTTTALHAAVIIHAVSVLKHMDYSR